MQETNIFELLNDIQKNEYLCIVNPIHHLRLDKDHFLWSATYFPCDFAQYYSYRVMGNTVFIDSIEQL